MEKNIYNSNNKLFAAGAKGEQLFEKVISESPTLIEWFGEIKEYEFITDLKIQKKGIDFVLTTTSGVITVDVKADSWLGKSNNLLAEYYVYYGQHQGKGWMWYGESDYIVFINENNSLMYVVNFPLFKEAALDYIITSEFNVKTNLTNMIKGKSVFNILVPEDRCWQCFKKYTLDS